MKAQRASGKSSGSSSKKGNVTAVRAPPSAMMIAAALSAAFPDVVSSCAVTNSAMPYASRNFVAHVARREAERVSSSQPTWIDEVFFPILMHQIPFWTGSPN